VGELRSMGERYSAIAAAETGCAAMAE